MSNWLSIAQNLKNLSSELQKRLEDLKRYSCRNSSEYFQTLTPEGRSVQLRLREDYKHYFELLRVLFIKHPESTNDQLQKSHDKILRAIDNKVTWVNHSCNNIFASALEALEHQIELLNEAFKLEKSRFMFIPDTNALIYNHILKDWYFDKISTFYILLLPTVLSELDKLKINHRNENVREKSKSLINQLKEYRRRGDLNKDVGVSIVKDKIYIQSKAIEPDFNNSLSWLDSTNNDDRIIAGFLEVMRQQTNSSVILVTSDINLQNKAAFACLPFTEPPKLKNDT